MSTPDEILIAELHAALAVAYSYVPDSIGLMDVDRALRRAEDRLLGEPRGEPTKWWRVVAPDGSVWCETSNESEARRNVRPGDTLQRLYEHVERRWRKD